jgi:hypothetical protein
MRSALIATAFLLLLSCGQENQSATSSTQVPVQTAEVSNDSIALVTPIKDFLHWYKTNYKAANNFVFVAKDADGNYQVNLQECEKYMAYLESSGLISNRYRTDWFKYFESKATYLKDNPQNEGPPEGFEFDLVLISQEPEVVLNDIDNMTIAITKIEGDIAVLSVSGTPGYAYDFEMGKEQGKWKIDYIATMNYD